MSEKVDLSRMKPLLEKTQGQEGDLISMLQEIQKTYSYLPEEALTLFSRKSGIPMSRIYAVATFYAQFYLNPRGKHIVRVCRGTACHVRGANLLLDAVERELGIKDGETTPDLEYSFESVACIGACALAPVLMVDEKTYSKVTPSQVSEILKYKK